MAKLKTAPRIIIGLAIVGVLGFGADWAITKFNLFPPKVEIVVNEETGKSEEVEVVPPVLKAANEAVSSAVEGASASMRGMAGLLKEGSK